MKLFRLKQRPSKEKFCEMVQEFPSPELFEEADDIKFGRYANLNMKKDRIVS